MAATGTRLNRVVVPLLFVVPLLAACSGGGATASGPLTSSSAAPPLASAVASPTDLASASPVSQAADKILRRALAAGSPWQAVATFEGEIADALVSSGSVSARGEDASITIFSTFPDETTLTVRQVVVGGWSYVQYRDFAWQRVPQDAAHPRPSSLRSALMTADYQVSQAGRLLVSGDDAVALAEALGIADPGTTDDSAEATMTLRPDGNPDRLQLGVRTELGRWKVEYAFEASPTVEPIAAPDDVVAMWQESGAFTLLYPDDWDTNSIGQAPEILVLMGSRDGAVTVWCEPTRFSLDGWTTDGVRAYSDEWNAKPTDTWTDTFGENTWNFTEYATATAAGDSGTGVVAATVHNGLGCDVTAFVFSSGNKDDLVGDFTYLLRSFAFQN